MMTERERIRRALGPLRASDDTLEEVLNMIEQEKAVEHRKRTGRHTLRAVAAAALVLALSVTAYAAGEYTGFFETVFGDEAIESEEGRHVELTDEDGNVWKKYDLPARERVAVDPDQAQTLVGDETVNVSKSVKVQDVTFTVEDFVIDANGIGALTYTMEDPNGFPGTEFTDDGGMLTRDPDIVGSQRGPNLALTDGEGGAISFLDSQEYVAAGGTGTKKTVVVYFAPFESFDGAENLTITFAVVKEHDPDAELYADMADEGSVSFPLSESAVALVLNGPDGWSANVSPVGLVITPPEGNPYGSNYVFSDLVIHMADGTDYVLKRSDPYTYNVAVACFGAGLETYEAFNRLIDPAQVESVTAAGDAHGYQDAGGQPVPYDEAWIDGNTLRAGLTGLDVDLDLTFTK